MRIKISSLGCRLNQSEIESVSTVLQEKGHVITRNDDADIYIINACAVTVHSERKTRKLINQSIKAIAGESEKKIIVTGCTGDETIADGNITYLSNDHKHLIPEIIENEIQAADINEEMSARFDYQTPLKASTTRINLKVQDGCDRFCSYCIIPYMRGGPQSKPLKNAVDEFKKLVDAGYKEIVLTGVMIGNYSWENSDLGNLVEKLLEQKGEYRIHLASISPTSVDDRLIDLFTHEKMVRHINLSLQSGSNRILEKMNRHYTRESYLNLVNKIRKKISLFNFTTDIIVGFPGESDDDFNDTLKLIKDAKFSHIHTFRYSPRPGTKAFELGDSVHESIKKERSRQVIELYTKQKHEFYKKFNGLESIIITEKAKKDYTPGFNEYYVPVQVEGKQKRNIFLKVKTYYDKSRAVLSAKTTV